MQECGEKGRNIDAIRKSDKVEISWICLAKQGFHCGKDRNELGQGTYEEDWLQILKLHSNTDKRPDT